MQPPPEITPAVVSRGARGALVVEIDGMIVGESPHLADAVHTLCEHAVRQQIMMVVSVASGAGRQYMTIDRNGIVSPSAAPAPRSAAPRPPSLTAPTLGASPNDEITQNEWVERYILDPANATPATDEPVPAKRRRSIFGRR